MALFACVSLVACGDDSSGSGPENTESSAVEESSSSIEVSSSSVNGDSGTGAGMTSSNSVDTSATVKADTSKITYALRPFDGPLANPHKGFTVPTGGAWTFVPEFEYGPYGSLNNRAWDLVSYGSGYQQWNKLNPAKGVYDWTELEKLLNALAEHNMGYALRVLPYTPSFIKSDFPPQEDYDWTPPFVYEMGAEKIQIDLRGTDYHAYAPVWDDSIYIWAAKEFAKALAEKYDGDPRIEYIDVRTFGEWGEWHTSHILGSVMPADSVLKDMLDYYASVFKKTQLVLPSNGFGDVYTHALDLGITKRDDGFIGIPGRPDTLLRAYNANLPTIAENIAGYKTMLTYDDLIPGGSQKWTAERWVDAITTAHLTYYVLDQDNDCGYYFYKDNKALADSMSKVIGYNFTVTQAELLTVAGGAETAGKFADTVAGNVVTNMLNITIKNTGVAPCFFNVYLVAEFVDSTGKALAQIGEAVRIPKGTFKDGASQEFSFSGDVPVGEANLATQPGVSVALSLYESEDAYKSGKNPTVRFDNDGLQGNNKLLLKSR
ncbi:MAG: hypothetical protein SPM09_06260 [Fibrobacter sp.]|uniref:hypothetical protein n=1 Tax=Fibrobacter sp. TaxID=35828 RepID=UPI002A91270D|nr:hypothetical protein [Fibrobacter sp.]MDY6263993.1 hypothetical protein [Fibrobacter sp.]